MPRTKCQVQGCKGKIHDELAITAAASTCTKCGQDVAEFRRVGLCEEHLTNYQDNPGDLAGLLLSLREPEPVGEPDAAD